MPIDEEKKKKLLELYKKSSRPEELFGDVIDMMLEMREQIAEMAEIVFDLPEPKDGAPGPRGPRGPAGKSVKGDKGDNGSPDSPEAIRDKLSSLMGKEKLSVLALKDLEWIRGRYPQQLGQYGGIPQPSGGAVFLYQETPAGTIDGINTVFTLSHVPQFPNVMIGVVNQGVQSSVLGDYTISASQITFASPPVAGSTIVFWYS